MEALRASVRDGEMVASECILLRELGSRPVPIHVAHRRNQDGELEVVVVERLARTGTARNLEHTALLMHDARRIALLNHPNIVRVRDVVVTAEDLLIVSDYTDGERYGELMRLAEAAGRPLPFAVHLRILVDVLLGLSGLHGVRDARGCAMNVFHGEVDPENIFIGLDGTARLAHVCRVRGIGQEQCAGVSVARMAPETLLGDQNSDLRCDIYSAGVILWEALTGRPLFAAHKAASILRRQLAGIERATAPSGEPWAAPLIAVAARALSADPGSRFANAGEMAAEIRKVAGAKLGAKGAVSACLEGVAGEKIRGRRAHLVPAAAASERALPARRLVSGTRKKAASAPPLPPRARPRQVEASPVVPAAAASTTQQVDGDPTDTMVDAPVARTPDEASNVTTSPAEDTPIALLVPDLPPISVVVSRRRLVALIVGGIAVALIFARFAVVAVRPAEPEPVVVQAVASPLGDEPQGPAPAPPTTGVPHSEPVLAPPLPSASVAPKLAPATDARPAPAKPKRVVYEPLGI